MRNTIRSLLVVGLLVWCLVGMFTFVTRDGLGPDSVASHGWEAFTWFFWTFYWGPIFVLLVAAIVWGRTATKSPRTELGESSVDP